MHETHKITQITQISDPLSNINNAPPRRATDVERQLVAFDPERNVTTATCMKYLSAHARRDEEGKVDALWHLVAIMLKATSDLYIPEPVRSEGDTAKYEFCMEFVLRELYPWIGKSLDEVEAAASKGVFRYMGRRCRQRCLNKIRDTQRSQRVFVTYNDEWQEHQTERCHIGPTDFDELLSECDFLDADERELATALYDVRELRAPERHRQLAGMRSSGVHEIRQRVRALQQKCQMAMAKGNSGGKSLYSALAAYVTTAKYDPPTDKPVSRRTQAVRMNEYWESEPDVED
jgi:hypothetical protein